ncbi:hypothetical protein RHOSPDRAFT_24416 [Rhodotorula sp. JG-1b]|nr:hypothetical protein RHOSPDRAFT_24416 [Rhodotorula sp. JG-1b]
MGMTMAQKRKARGPALAAPSKGKGRALPVITPAAAPPHKRAKLAAKAAGKASNRPRNDDDDESEPEAESAQDAHAAMLAALEAHQASFFAGALPSQPVASTSGAGSATRTAAQKSVWEMDDADFLDDDDDDDDEDEDEDEYEDDEGQEEGHSDAARQAAAAAAQAKVVAFVEPGRNTAGDAGLTASAPPVMDKRELRDFKAGKVKNLHVKASVADAANVKYVGGKAARQKAKLAAGDVKGAAALQKQAEEQVEETQLSKLDAHLSSLIKPLTSGGSASLPDLLRELPIASSKPLKGHTPLPKNAPRLLRKGQNAANLKRAQARDDAAGFGQGAKKGAVGMGREALSLKEKRKAEGTDKRQRGIGGAAGKWGRGQLSLSQKEIRSING